MTTSATPDSTPAPDPSAALEALLERYGALMRLAGIRRGLVTDDVDDLLQEIRLRLWRASARGENLAALPASYLYRTASSAAVDMLRRRRALREEALTPAHDREGPVTQDPAALAAGRELGAAVAAALETLAPNRRPVVRMYLAGYTREEIGTLLGWTDAKTRNLLYRGLDDLRGVLSARGYAPEGVGR